MTIKNRETFLENVATNLGRPRRTSNVKRPTWSVYPQKEIYKDYTRDELVEVLKKQCEAIHTDFRRTTTDQLPNTLIKTIDNYNGNTIIVSDDHRFETYGLVNVFNDLKSNGSEVHMWNASLEIQNQKFAERANIGITFSDVTLAESGTVTLFNDKHNERSISLLPKYYIAIIPATTLVPRLTQATEQINKKLENGEILPSCISFISGPSNSADIEMNLIVGVHGPVKATYIVVEDA